MQNSFLAFLPFSFVAAMLLAGVVLRRYIPFFQKFLVPASIIGGLLAWPVAVFLMGKAAGDIAFYAYVVPFLVSTVGGSIIAGVVLIALEKNGALKKMQASLAR